MDFATITQWWLQLEGKEIIWQQRMISGMGDWRELDWSAQQFDERFFIKNLEVRGITLFWRKANELTRELSTTPHSLTLDLDREALYIFPQSRQGLVLRVSLPMVRYQTVDLRNPTLERAIAQGNFILTLKDPHQAVEVRVTLSPESLLALKRLLP